MQMLHKGKHGTWNLKSRANDATTNRIWLYADMPECDDILNNFIVPQVDPFKCCRLVDPETPFVPPRFFPVPDPGPRLGLPDGNKALDMAELRRLCEQIFKIPGLSLVLACNQQ